MDKIAKLNQLNVDTYYAIRKAIGINDQDEHDLYKTMSYETISSALEYCEIQQLPVTLLKGK